MNMKLVSDESFLAGDYVSGPIPIAWFTTAINTTGCTFRLAMLIWHYWKLRKAPVRVSMVKCRQIGIGRKARNTALDVLESLGLIEILHYDNRSPVVDIIGGK